MEVELLSLCFSSLSMTSFSWSLSASAMVISASVLDSTVIYYGLRFLFPTLLSTLG